MLYLCVCVSFVCLFVCLFVYIFVSGIMFTGSDSTMIRSFRSPPQQAERAGRLRHRMLACRKCPEATVWATAKKRMSETVRGGGGLECTCSKYFLLWTGVWARNRAEGLGEGSV